MSVAPTADTGVAPQDPIEASPKKKGRTNTPWTAEEEQRLKVMRDAGKSWSEIAKVSSSCAIPCTLLLMHWT
jgi:hypothetical protein